MHFQIPPYDHAKLVYVTDGEILDVAVDIRKNSLTFGQYFSTVLSNENAKSLYIAKGFAHGFLTLSESATVVYMTTTVHAPKYDRGIRWDSFGFDWD
ncbi:dTDP-4-dehydrorhamnose 3,5-epimerase [Vibrio sp. PP-XX7]